MKRLISFAFAAGLLLVLAGAVDSQTRSPLDPPSCEIEPGADIDRLHEQLGATVGPKGTPEFMRWLEEEGVEAIGAGLSKLSESNSDVDGYYINYLDRTFNLVIQPGGDLGEIESSMKSIDMRGYSLLFRQACFTTDQRAEALDRLDRASKTDGPRYSYGYYIDERDGRVVVHVNEVDRADMNARLADNEDVIRVEIGETGSTSRANDGEPHWGGAGVRNGVQSSNTCSTGFTVKYGSSTKHAMVTAFHCRPSSPSSYWYSGSEYYGYELSGSSFQADALLIGSGVETYRNKLHVDPCCPSSRTVTNYSDPVQWYNVCVSGSVSLAKCSVTIIDSNFYYCPGFSEPACYAGKNLGSRSGVQITVGGDSGGPAYTAVGSGSASIRGMIMGNSAGTDRAVISDQSEITSLLSSATGKSISVATWGTYTSN